ncbi:myb-like protein X [Mytilus trossulus]|uniref:myb-like protein X n=1 Tax=Mytilus trossulus TaxID=6551 RepID=UPI003007E8E2
MTKIHTDAYNVGSAIYRWNGKNKVDDHKISSTINKESTENNGRKQTNKPNNDEKKEREYKENSDLGNNEVVSSKPNSDKQTGKIVGNPKELNADNNKIQSEKANNSRKTNRNKRRKTDNEFETNEDEKTKRQRNKKRNKKDEKANHMDKCATVKEINANHSHNEKHNKRDENGSHIHKCGTENERKENHSYKDNQKQTEPFCNKEYSSEKCEATPDDKNNAIRNSRIHTARDSREAAIRKIEMKNTDSEITRPKSAQDSKYPDKGSLESHENNQNQTAPPKSQVQTLIMVGEAC